VRDDLDLHFVRTVDEALALALEPLPVEPRPLAA
jgi:hypothetical protein